MSDAEGSDTEGGLALGMIFTEPPRPPSPEPTIAVYQNVEGDDHRWSTISVRLVGSHPLWGHYLWNAARSLATFLQRTPELYVTRTVLELGAGGGLPGLVAAKCGARKVVLTDYPDQALLDNLVYNVAQNVEPARRDALCVVRGYVWGHPLDSLLRALNLDLDLDCDLGRQGKNDGGDGDGDDPVALADDSDADLAAALHPDPGLAPPSTSSFFDLVLLSDLIFNHSQHRALLTTCERALAPARGSGGGCVLVFYTHHRPHLAHRDMAFFEMARETGWECEEVLTERFPPMFPDDAGEEVVRSTVHGWKLTRARHFEG